MPTGWRIVKTGRAATAFDGEGARLHGGRWNSPGSPVVYTAESVALAALELLVHLQSSKILSAYSTIAAHFDKRLINSVNTAELPNHWRSYPALIELQQIGNDWVAEQRSAVLEVPSAIVPNEHNYLINPLHSDFSSIHIDAATPFEFDTRLKR